MKPKARGDRSPARSCRYPAHGNHHARQVDHGARSLKRQVKAALDVTVRWVKSGSITAWMSSAGAGSNIRLRQLEAGDSLNYLTDMLHRAFLRIGGMGIPCSCVSQPTEVTARRISRGDCFVILWGDRIVGTVTLYGPEAASDCKHYRNARVGTLRQLAVDPLFHSRGIGNALLYLAEEWALRRGYKWLALDTPAAAAHLVDYYQRHGFCIKESLQFTGRPYLSLVFSKSAREPGAPVTVPVSMASDGTLPETYCTSHYFVSRHAAPGSARK